MPILGVSYDIKTGLVEILHCQKSCNIARSCDR